MTKYTVVVSAAAASDIAESFAYIQERSPLEAERWLRAVYQSIHELEQFAGYGRALEAEYLGTDLRQKSVKSHRIVYSVDRDAQQVVVHYVRHSARRALGEPSDHDEA